MAFFVISGFWISRSISRSVGTGTWSWTNYLINRLSRLLIVLVPAMVIGGLFDVIGRFGLRYPLYFAFVPTGGAPVDIATHLRPIDLVGNLAFLQDMAVRTWGSNGPLWSLACEFWYYVWFPTAMLLIGRRWSRKLILATIVTIVTASLSSQVTLLFVCWLVGAAVHVLDNRLRSVGSERWRIPIVGMALVICVAAEVLSRWHAVEYFIDCYAIAIGFGIFLLAVLRFEVGPPAIMKPLSIYGSGSSFSLYAIHLPLLIFIIAALNGSQRMQPSLLALATVVATAVALILFALVFSRFTELRTGVLRDVMRSCANALRASISRRLGRVALP